MTKKVRTKNASRTEIVDMIQNTNGKICTITYIKKDGTTRVMNCNRQKGGLTNLGYILVNDLQEKGDKKTKSVDPRTIQAFAFKGKRWVPKD